MADTGNMKVFGTAPDGGNVYQIVLENGGAMAAILTYGATLQEYRIRNNPHSLVLGSPDFAAYLTPEFSYFGPIVGRVANRIARGSAQIDGRFFELERNENNITTLHGGSAGSSNANWKIEETDEHSCRLSLLMPDGGSGFPGNLAVTAKYSLDKDGALILELSASSDQTTLCNFAQHSYWNLDGEPDISHHHLTVHADEYLETDSEKIPLDNPVQVAGTEFDFRQSKPVLNLGHPIDHNFCLAGRRGDLRPAAVLSAKNVRLRILTTEPGLQVYDGGHLNTGGVLGNDGKPYNSHAGLALEPQAWPDAPNHEGFPSIELLPGEHYRQTSIFHGIAD